MSQTSPQKQGPPVARSSSRPFTTNAVSTPRGKPEAPSHTTSSSGRAVRFVSVENGASECQAGREDTSSVELVTGKPPTADSAHETSKTPRPDKARRKPSNLLPSARRIPSTSVPKQSNFVERISTSTATTTEGGEDTTSAAGPSLRVLSRLPAASGGVQRECGEQRNIDRAGSRVSRAATGGVYRTQRSVAGEAFTLQRSAQFQRPPSLATRTYGEVTDDDAEVIFGLKDATGGRGARPLSVQWGSGDLNNEETSTVPCAEISLALVPIDDTCARQACEEQEAGAAAGTSNEGVQATTNEGVQATAVQVNQEAQVTCQGGVEGRGRKEKSTREPPKTLKSYVLFHVAELTKHPILDSGRRRIPLSTLRGQLCLTFCTGAAILFVFTMQLVLDRTTFHGRCISPILYPSYRLPYQDRVPYPVLFGYGACEYNLGRSELYRRHSTSTTPSAGQSWPADNVDVRSAPEFGKLNVWSISAMGALDANKIRNYGEYFRLFTSAFMHGGWLHLISNLSIMLVLLWIIEPVWGFLRTALTYFVSALTANLCASVLNPCTISVGASGALYGLVGALFPLAIEFWDYLEYPVWLLTLVVSSVAVSQVLNFSVFTNVDNWAHTAGLFAGMTFGFATVTSLHAWRWEGVFERLASSRAFSWMFSPENGQRLRDANRMRVQQYRRRRRSGKPLWPKVVWEWKGHKVEWSLRVLSSSLLASTNQCTT